jgi:hypothetical protein
MTNLPALQDWEQYPLCFSRDQYVGLDLQDQHDKLIEATPRIFSGQGEIEMWIQREDSQGRKDFISLSTVANITTRDHNPVGL